MSVANNPKVKLAQLPVGYTWARLEALYFKELVFDFILNPEEIVWSHRANFNELAVLHSGQPQLAFKNSISTISLPKIALWSPGNSGDLSAIKRILTDMTKPALDQKTPPLLHLTFGTLDIPKVYLSTFQLREQQWRSGKLTSGVCSLDFIIVPEPPKVLKADVATKLTERQQKSYGASVSTALKKDRTRAKSLGVDPTKDKIIVTPEGNVLVGTKTIGGLKETFPDVLRVSDSNVSGAK